VAESRKLAPASYVAELADETAPLSVDVTPLAGSRFKIKVEERPIEIEAEQVGPHTFSVRLGDRVVELDTTWSEGNLVVGTAGKELAFRLIDRRRYRAGGDAATGIGQREVKAVMPGKVVAVLVNVGDEVEKGQSLLVLEAMKMENEVRSPGSGVVQEIRVSPGQAVETGELMLLLE
jgi:biotin carboxyl carrier protein